MPCKIPLELIDETIAFHGHSCPGLAIGIRVVELAMRELGAPEDIDMVAVSETDMCGVDAIQYLTGCTYGKGNFVHRDHGKMAFSFFDRQSGKGVRALLNPKVRNEISQEFTALMAKEEDGTATPDEEARLAELRIQLRERFMAISLDTMFSITETRFPTPRPAMILESLTCDCCGESVMESRTRRLGGQTMCIPCFNEREQKI